MSNNCIRLQFLIIEMLQSCILDLSPMSVQVLNTCFRISLLILAGCCVTAFLAPAVHCREPPRYRVSLAAQTGCLTRASFQ
jgi:hypothetical protein